MLKKGGFKIYISCKDGEVNPERDISFVKLQIFQNASGPETDTVTTKTQHHRHAACAISMIKNK